MFIGRVVGNVWATRKHHSLNKMRMLLVQPIDGITGKPEGDVTMMVCDEIDAGMGDTVLYMDEGSSTRFILGDNHAPIRTTVVGIVDSVTVGDKKVDYH